MIEKEGQKSLYTPKKSEDRRLALQNELLNSFDRETYEKVLSDMPENFCVLDVGCGSGVMLSEKLKPYENCRYLGIDKSERQIEKAKKNMLPECFAFEVMDIEEESFSSDLGSLMSSRDIKSFDLISISMVLLHLTDPEKLLKILHGTLSKNGWIIIRDIDDKLNLAYPDEDGWFDRLFRIGCRDEQTGKRFAGRRICSYLTRAGFSNIRLNAEGLSTAGLNKESKEAYYDMSIRFIVDNQKSMYDKYPEDEEITEDYRWTMENREEIHGRFMKEDFMLSLGFMSYTARF